jgi:hypothetical protein
LDAKVNGPKRIACTITGNAEPGDSNSNVDTGKGREQQRKTNETAG